MDTGPNQTQMVVRDLGQMVPLHGASLHTVQWDSTESHPLKYGWPFWTSIARQLFLKNEIQKKKKSRPKKQNCPKQNHIWMRSHMHTSLHLSSHAKNSITARSVTLANISMANAASCCFQELWKMYAWILEDLRNIKQVF